MLCVQHVHLKHNDACLFLHLLVVSCPSPLEGINTILVNTSTSYVYGDVYTYKCEGGYEFSGALQSTCQPNGTWSLSPPACTGILH